MKEFRIMIAKEDVIAVKSDGTGLNKFNNAEVVKGVDGGV